MQVTVLSPWYPHPADNGAKLRVMALLRALAREHILDLIVLGTTNESMDVGPLAEICRSVTTIALRPFAPSGPRSWLAFLSAIPRSVSTTYNPEITTCLNDRIRAGECDALFCYCSGDLRAAWYATKVSDRVPIVIDDPEPSRYLDLTRNASTRVERGRASLVWWKYRRFVRSVLGVCTGCLVTSEREAALLREIIRCPDRIAVVPNGVTVATELAPSNQDACRIVYNGAPTYGPNLDAVTYFGTEILPRIRARRPGVWLAVTGSTQGVELGNVAATDGVTFTGWLPDIRAFVAGSRVCVVPLRQGGGTRLKILEAMTMGTPVVATPKGAEGLDLIDGEDILIADSAEAFADATVRLLTDDDLHRHIAAHARATVTARFDWESIGADMLVALARITGATRDHDVLAP